jgi:DNA-binding response OmpR family regulator
MRILLVEDDIKSARILKRGLEEEDFTVEVVHRGEDVDEAVAGTGYDLVILDWLLPGKQGIEVCRDLRSRDVTTPILMLTAKDAVAERVEGLETGADDYLTKPFAFWELLARINALLRRAGAPRPPALVIGDLKLDPVRHRVTRLGNPISLTTKEYAILECLMRHRGEPVARSRIGVTVWGEDFDPHSNLLDVHLSNLRKKIDSDADARLIHNVRGQGYRVGPKTA